MQVSFVLNHLVRPEPFPCEKPQTAHSNHSNEDRPDYESDNSYPHNRLDEIACNQIRQFLDRRPAPLRFRDHMDDLRQKSICADSFGPHQKGPGPVHRGPYYPFSVLLFNKNGLSGNQDLEQK